MKRAWVVTCAVTAALLLVPAAAGAATFTVNTTADTTTPGCTGGECSLRQATEAADANGEDDTINFALPNGSTITLTEGHLTINPGSSSEALTINGPGANLLTVALAAGTTDRVIVSNNGIKTIKGLTITGGNAGTSFQAAGIDNESGDMTLDGVIVTGNTNDGGGFNAAGGILNVFGFLTIRNSTVSNNVVNDVGNGIAFGGGGGVVSHPGDTLIINSTISGNQVHGDGTDMGGGVWNAGGGTITLVNDTIANNSVDGGGG